jgi:hypothetical protein
LQESSARLESVLQSEQYNMLAIADALCGLEQVMEEVLTTLNSALTALPLPLHTSQPATLRQQNNDRLKEILLTLEPLVRDRKPRPCLPLLEELNGLQWPDHLRDTLKEVVALIQKYRMKEALSQLQAIVSAL